MKKIKSLAKKLRNYRVTRKQTNEKKKKDRIDK